MNVIGYLRVSGKSQVEGDGPERQRGTINLFCAGHGLTVVDFAFEAAVSGTVEAMERPVFAEVIERIENSNGSISGIVVERADRLARDLMVSELLLRECRERGIKVFSADRELIDLASDQSDPTQVLIRQIMAALAQWEKSQLVLKLKKSRERIRATGRKCEGKRAMNETPRGRMLLSTFKSLLTADLDDRKRAGILNAMGIFRMDGKRWWHTDVYQLRRKIEAGIF